MAIRVEYHIDDNYFTKHKKEFQQILPRRIFEIAQLRFEKRMIAHHFSLWIIEVRRALSYACAGIRRSGFKI